MDKREVLSALAGIGDGQRVKAGGRENRIGRRKKGEESILPARQGTGVRDGLKEGRGLLDG